MLPNIITIGAQKAATTFIQRAFEDHPEVASIPGETVTFEDPYYSVEAVSKLKEGFRRLPAKKRRVVKMAEYLSRPEVPERLHRHIPDCQFIAVLRDPVERFLSAYYHMIRYGALPVVHHSEGIPMVMSGEWARDYPLSQQLLPYGRYGEHLKRYFRYFEREQFLCLLHHEVALDSEAATRQIYRFAGIDESHKTASLARRSQAVVYSMPRLKILALRGPFCFRKTTEGKRLRTGWIGKAAWYGGEAFDRWVMEKVWKNKRPVLSDDHAKLLYEYYAADIDELEVLLSTNLGSWKHSARGGVATPGRRI